MRAVMLTEDPANDRDPLIDVVIFEKRGSPNVKLDLVAIDKVAGVRDKENKHVEGSRLQLNLSSIEQENPVSHIKREPPERVSVLCFL